MTPNWRRTAAVVAITQIVVLVGFGIALPFLPLYMQELGLTDRAELALWTGVISGAAGIAMATFAPIWGAVADRYGRKAMLMRALVGGTLVLAAMGFVNSVWQLFVLRVVQGILTGTQTAAVTLVASIVPRNRAGVALGLVSTAAQIGNFVGPLVGAIAIAGVGFRASFVASGALLGVSAVATALWVEDSPLPPRPEELSTKLGERVRRLVEPFGWESLRGIIVLQFATQMVFSSTLALLPIYILDLARPSWLSAELVIGLALAFTAIAAALSTPGFGWWIDRHGTRDTVLAGIAVTALALVPQGFTPPALVFLGLRVLVGVGVAGVSSSLAVLTRDATPAGGEGRGYGTSNAANMLGWGVGPLVGSAIAATLGLPALYLIAGLLAAALLVPLLSVRGWLPLKQTA